MYLKRIEVQGFKSFANKIIFDFHDGITGIVGPNGSGKSNVADAVRWVLGEQRIKQLRGSNMQDVIFSGTENRKPLSYAKVSITLDNSDHMLPVDYEELTVTRKLYRSGESEYIMNNVPCRLRDINELFYDTGIGKEGYSIIGQGQIDKILSGKPEERRELFDEAAGIVKFKRRRNLTQKKLEEERANLVRVTDILEELERQVVPLEKQAAVARQYLKLHDELKAFDINMFLLEMERIVERQNEAEEALFAVRREYRDAVRKLDETKEQYQELEAELDGIQKSVEDARNQRNQTEILKKQLEGQIGVLNEQINAALQQDRHYGDRVNDINRELDKRNEQLVLLADEASEIEKILERSISDEEKAEKALEELRKTISEKESLIEEKQSELIRTLNERASVKANLERYDTMLEQNRLQKAQLNQRLLAIKSEETRFRDTQSQYRAECDDLKKQISEKELLISDIDKQITSLQLLVQKETEELAVTRNEFHRSSSRLEALKDLTERYEGYGGSVRRIMEKKEDNAGIIGVVADIIQTERKYELAVETALGRKIQNIVVDNENTAKEMISFLKASQSGRATFLPLTNMKRRESFQPAEALSETGVIGVADDLIGTDDKYRDLASSLLGDILVVETIDQGIAIAKKYDHRIKIVSLEGDMMHPGGSMSGGSYKNSGNLLSRRREIEELSKLSDEWEKKGVSLSDRIEAHRNERTDAYARLDDEQTGVNELKIRLRTAQLNLETAEEQQASVLEDVSSIEEECRRLDGQVKEITVMKDTFNEQLAESARLEKSTSDAIRAVDEETAALHRTESEMLQSVEELHLHSAANRQKDDFINQNKERILGEIEAFNSELKQLDENKADMAELRKEKEAQIKTIKERIADSADVFETIDQEIAGYEQKRIELNDQHKAFIELREELSGHVSELDKESFRLQSRKDSYDESLEKQIDYMWEEYELTYDDAGSLRNNALTDLTYMRKHVSELKSSIRSLGPVNVNAVEDFRQLNERYTFLKTQHDDLIKAEASLISIIADLNSGMKKQFAAQFAAINEEYNRVFQQLFGGGKGSLELIDDDDLLETGIQIIAQPPGKKLQNMMQLSGGEKALTAIALLFAIQNMKPSPFCLLDEIEAALDDSNVVRFADYLQNMTGNTQFIIITHRRGTMAAADRLYGITMQEKGVSTLVSVDLVEDKLDK